MIYLIMVNEAAKSEALTAIRDVDVSYEGLQGVVDHAARQHGMLLDSLDTPFLPHHYETDHQRAARGERETRIAARIQTTAGMLNAILPLPEGETWKEHIEQRAKELKEEQEAGRS